MQTVRDNLALESALSTWAANGERIAFVPTMGALHEGHLALIVKARTLADRVVASIFVNPLQFNDPKDLERYPREEASDLTELERAGCDLVWLPGVADLYPDGFATTVSVAGISERWEGEHRPGHFDGVATVVTKLFNAVAPNIAVFGEKDFQQLAVIRRMATDLGLCENIVGVPTVRDSDGLALSSRNALLSPDERRQAVALPRALNDAREAIRAGEPVADVLRQAKQSLVDAGFFRIDYFALVDAATLKPLDQPAGEMRLIAAAVMGSTRLIDNVAV